MNYPTSVIVRGAVYRILYHDKMREVDADLEFDQLLGQADHTNHILRIYKHQTSLDLLDTVVHEILHAIFSRNKALRLALKKDVEERFIDTLANEIALILIDNGWFTPTQGPPLTNRIIDCEELEK